MSGETIARFSVSKTMEMRVPLFGRPPFKAGDVFKVDTVPLDLKLDDIEEQAQGLKDRLQRLEEVAKMYKPEVQQVSVQHPEIKQTVVRALGSVQEVQDFLRSMEPVGEWVPTEHFQRERTVSDDDYTFYLGLPVLESPTLKERTRSYSCSDMDTGVASETGRAL